MPVSFSLSGGSFVITDSTAGIIYSSNNPLRFLIVNNSIQVIASNLGGSGNPAVIGSYALADITTIGGSPVAGTLAEAVAQLNTLTVSALPTGAATAANQTTGNASLASIDGKTPALSGGKVPVTDPVALPLPSGAATSALQGTGNTSLVNIEALLAPVQARLYDPTTLRYHEIDQRGGLSVYEVRRLFGSGFGTSVDTTYQYTTNIVGTGTVGASGGVMTAATGTTANSSAELISRPKMRAEFGKVNLFRAVARFQQAGAANNVTFIRIYVDANTEFGFRTNGAASSTNFEIYYKKAGVITSIPNGSFNGNGTLSNQTLTQLLGSFSATQFNGFEIKYYYQGAIFYINKVAIHTLIPTTTILLTALGGQISTGSVNSGGSTTNCGIELIGWGCFQNGGVANNPLYYNYAGAAGVETRTLKGGGGTLHAITVGSPGGNGSSITFYDNTAGSGTIIEKFDLSNTSVIGDHTFGNMGVNFSNGLTYVTAGTLTNASVTILWE